MQERVSLWSDIQKGNLQGIYINIRNETVKNVYRFRDLAISNPFMILFNINIIIILFSLIWIKKVFFWF